MLSLSFSSPDSIIACRQHNSLGPVNHFCKGLIYLCKQDITGVGWHGLLGQHCPLQIRHLDLEWSGHFLSLANLVHPEVLPLRCSSLLFWWVAFYQKPKGYWVYWIEDVYLKSLFLSVAKLEIFRLYFIIQSAFLLMDTSLIEITTPHPSPSPKKKRKKRIDWVPATLALEFFQWQQSQLYGHSV